MTDTEKFPLASEWLHNYGHWFMIHATLSKILDIACVLCGERQQKANLCKKEDRVKH